MGLPRWERLIKTCKPLSVASRFSGRIVGHSEQSRIQEPVKRHYRKLFLAHPEDFRAGPIVPEPDTSKVSRRFRNRGERWCGLPRPYDCCDVAAGHVRPNTNKIAGWRSKQCLV